jgi:vitamin B12 transporter
LSANRPVAFILTLLTLLLSLSAPVLAIEPVEDSLVDLSVLEQSAVATPRYTRPISRIAENATVITAGQIATLNAHTLADVLQTIPGVQLEQMQTPGAFTFFSVQGASDAYSHVLVLIDGVKITNQLQGQADPGLIPVQQIERVEIIKGAAAGSWGQALGGVVNVVTKSPASLRAIGGSVSASLGEHATRDNSAEVSGTVNRFGYYLSGGSLYSRGLLPNNGVNANNGYGKFTYDLPNKGKLTGGLSYNESNRGLDENDLVHDDDTTRRSYIFLTFTYPLGEQLTLELTGKASDNKANTKLNDVIDGVITPYLQFKTHESTRGGSAKLVWGDSRINLTAGGEYEHGEVEQRDVLSPDSPYLTDQQKDAFAAYANGTVSFGELTLLPGIRFDHTGLGDDDFSYSLGATYSLSEKTLLRVYGAKGFGLPIISFENGPQEVWTVQAGVESETIPYLCLKGTLFYNDITNATVSDFDLNNPGVTHREQIKQGFELEARTTPLYGFSLAGGYTYIDARDRDSGDRLELVPSNLLKASLHYDEKSIGLKGIVTANYVKWNAPADNNARYSATITDLHLTQRLCPHSDSSPEIFFSVRNLFNGAQYQNDSTYSTYKNTPRWIEGGVRFSF